MLLFCLFEISEHVLDCLAVFSAEPVEDGQPFFQLFQPVRAEALAVLVFDQAIGQLPDGDGRLAQRFVERPEDLNVRGQLPNRLLQPG